MDPLSPEERRFIEEHLGLVYHMAWRTPVGEFDDRVQDGVFGLVEAIRRHDPDRCAFATYASTVIHGRIIDGHRKRVHRRRAMEFVSMEDADVVYVLDSVTDLAAGPEDQTVAALERERRSKALHEALAQLRPAQAEAAMASVEVGGQQRIARRHNLTEGAITRRKQAAFRYLRELLHDL